MNNESLVHNLYSFIKSEATMEKLQEANKKAFPKVSQFSLLPYDKAKEIFGEAYEMGLFGGDELEFNKHGEAEIRQDRDWETYDKEEVIEVGSKLIKIPKDRWETFSDTSLEEPRNLIGKSMEEIYKIFGLPSSTIEGKLPDDPSQIKDPDGDIQKLSEKEVDTTVNKDIKTANAGVTNEPEKTDIQKEAEKDTPTDKLTQDKKGQDPLAEPSKVKDEKKITPEVSSVDKVKEDRSPYPVDSRFSITKRVPITFNGIIYTAHFSGQEGHLQFENALDKNNNQPKNFDEFMKELAKIVPFNDKVKEQKISVEELAKELRVSVDVVKVIQDALRKDMEKSEGKLPKDPSKIEDPEGDIQDLSEEKVLTTVSDEKVAQDISSKYPGSRVVKDEKGNQFMVMVKEAKVNEAIIGTPVYLRDLKDEVKGELLRDNPSLKNINDEGKDIIVGYFADEPKVQEAKKKIREMVVGDQVSLPGNRFGEVIKISGENAAIKLNKEGTIVQRPINDPEVNILSEKKVKEDVTVTVDADGKETVVTAVDGGGVQVTSVEKEATEPVTEPIVNEPVIEEEPEFLEGEEEINDDEAEEMAEKITVIEYLKNKKVLTEKQKKFLNEVKGVKMGKKNKQKVGKALKQLGKKK